MKAIVVKPKIADSIHMRDMPDPNMGADQVAVKMIRVGLCGTDAEIEHGLYGDAPDGDEFLILGHENFGVVEEVGKEVKGWKAGDLVVATVRRPCGVCPYCQAGEFDMCTSGQYTERGIMRRHGYMAQYYVESPQYLHRIPKSIRDVAVLLEPMSVVEKGIDHAFLLQRRMKKWMPRLGVVIGPGPVGLLGAAVLATRGLRSVIIGRSDASEPKAQIAKAFGVEYVSSANRTLQDVIKEIGEPDIILEATGSAQVVFDAMQAIGPSGVLCLLSVTGGDTMKPEPIDLINQQLVLGNRVVFGSVNANARHFDTGVKDMVKIEKQYPGVLKRMLNQPIAWENHAEWFKGRGSSIKATLEISS
jgi:threonine dehydrogenase-like Zn-dependent dehydrogenase